LTPHVSWLLPHPEGAKFPKPRSSCESRVSVSSAIRWAQRFQETGGWQAKPTGGDRRSRAIEAHKDWLLALIAQQPDLTLMEIRGRLAADKTFAASVSALWRFFDRHGISFKKNAARRRTGPRRRQSGA
jgi:transposase